jgi:hypothetical protein
MAGLVKKRVLIHLRKRDLRRSQGQSRLGELEGRPVGRPFRARLAVVQARQADCQDRQLPGSPRGLVRVRANESGHGRRGREAEFGPGDFMICPTGYGAWIVGGEAFVVIDCQGVGD